MSIFSCRTFIDIPQVIVMWMFGFRALIVQQVSQNQTSKEQNHPKTFLLIRFDMVTCYVTTFLTVRTRVQYSDAIWIADKQSSIWMVIKVLVSDSFCFRESIKVCIHFWVRQSTVVQYSYGAFFESHLNSDHINHKICPICRSRAHYLIQLNKKH